MIALMTSLERNGWWLVVAGLLCLYLPTYWDLANGIWQTDEQFHGVIILLIVLWLLLRSESQIWQFKGRPSNGIGSASLAFGLILYILGRSQEILLFEVGSQIPVLAGVLLLMSGKESLYAAWFPLLYSVFMLPLPSSVVDSLTGPLKQGVSYFVEQFLYQAGYPIARQGVVLMIGRYELLIADACSGLNSMFSLAALGLLFMYLISRRSLSYNLLMVASIIPIAFLANVVRVSALVLITFYLGDEAGQGFMHGFAGMVLFVTALGGFFLLDIVLGLISRSGDRI